VVVGVGEGSGVGEDEEGLGGEGVGGEMVIVGIGGMVEDVSGGGS